MKSYDFIDCFNQQNNKYLVEVYLKTDIEFEAPISFKISGNVISIERQNTTHEYKTYKVISEIISSWHIYAENFIEKFIYDLFSMNGGFVIIKRPFSVKVYCHGKWISHPSVNVELFVGKVVNKEVFADNIDLVNKLYYAIENGSLSKKCANKIDTILSLLKKGNSLKKDFCFYGDSFLSFYKVVEIIVDDIKSNKSDPLIKVSNEINTEIDNFITTNQKSKIEFILKALNINIKHFGDNITFKDIFKLSDIRNKLAHSSYNVNIDELDLMQNLSTCITKKYINSLNV